jgi:SAM-dependent methyltransferase
MKPNYYRDVWILGPSTNDCPGSFPRGFVPALKRKWWGQRRLWVCSGGFKDSGGVTLDIRPSARSDVLGDAEVLPFKNACFDFVMADPPYSEAEAKALYDLPYLSMTKLINEMIRVCEPNGHVILLHRLIPGANSQTDTGKMSVEGVVGVGVLGAWANIRALTVFRKRQELESWGGKE